MTLVLLQTVSAIGIGTPANFQAVGGSVPYVYSVVPGGAGGSIDSVTGNYTTPQVVNPSPAKSFDTILVTDNLGATATAQILVTTPMGLFCEIIQNQMGLADGRVYFWDQKLFQPKDYDLYVAVSVASSRPFGNVNRQSASGTDSEQYISVCDILDVDIISRGPSARDRKAEILLALNSNYAEQQQNFNSFFIGKLPMGQRFTNLSNVDGAAIPYRFRISVAIQYAYAKVTPIEYFDKNFFPIEVVVDTGQIEFITLDVEDGNPLLTEDGDNIAV